MRAGGAIVALGIVALAAGTAAAASGPVGSLTFQGCLRDSGSSSPCATVGTGLKQGNHAVVAPDGEHVYTTAWASTGAVNVFRRNAGGGLTQIDSVDGDTINRAIGLALSPDGTTLYVTATASSALSVFRIDGGDTLTRIQCFSQSVISGCTQVPGLLSAVAVTLSPDGKNVYVASGADSMTNGTLAVFQRQSDGILTFGSCFKETGAAGDAGCAQLPGMTGAKSVAVSPDGQNVYLAASAAVISPTGVVRTFTRNADGSLLPAGCIRALGSTAPDGCTPTPGINATIGLAISPDGANVYVVGFRQDSIASFARGPGGALTSLGCFRESGLTGDAECTLAEGLSGGSVTVSADGDNVYTSGEGGVIGVFLRNADGTLAPSTCLRNFSRTSDTSCVQVIGLGGPEAVALSPDGTSAYAATFFDGEVTSLVRQARPTCGSVAIAASGGVPATVPTACSDANADPVTVAVATPPAHGSVSGPDGAGAFVYTPALGYGGADSFTFVANDGSVDSHPATVTIDVTPSTPVVSEFTVSPVRFRPGRNAPAPTARGTTFAYDLSEAAVARIAIGRTQKGRLDGGTCVAPTPALRRAPRCKRLVVVGTVEHASDAGANALPFSGRIDGKALRPGRYDAALTATNAAGRSSEPRSASLRVTQ